MNTLAPLSASASRLAQFNNPALSRPAADVQAALANRLAERLGLETGALRGTRDDFSPEQVADRVLGFIEQRLRHESAAGADPARLQGLLSQARAGVEKGFAEARKILDGMGALQGKVAADIDDTYRRIQEGLGNLEQRFTPAPTIAAYSERFVAVAETFELAVTTRDGDRLRISIAQAAASWSQTGVAVAHDGNGNAVRASGQAGSLQLGAWQIAVEGELDEHERAALGQLLGQVQELSGKFYAGDLAGAFDRALALELDGEQLASMSLRLTQTSVRQATDAYGAVAGQAASVVNAALLDYAQGLLVALRSANDLLEDARGSLQALLEGGFALDERFDAPRQGKAAQLNSRLLDGLQGLLESGLSGGGKKAPPAVA